MFYRSITASTLLIITCHLTYAQSKIIFSRAPGQLNSGNTPDLMIYDPSTSQTRLLMKGTVQRRGEYNAAVAKDGSSIIFNTYRFSGWKLAIADYKNGKIANVRRFTNRRNYEYNPSWSNDGQEVAYQEFSWTTRETEIFIKNMASGNIRQFTNSEGGDRLPAWTYDDANIVFTSGRTGNYEIFMADKEGKAFVNITNNDALDIAPSCSPIDNRVAFISNRTGRHGLYILDPDKGTPKLLTSGLDSDPSRQNEWDSSGSWAYKTSWSPDGKSIVFTLPIDGDLEIFIIDIDGQNLKQITDNDDTDFSPHWVN